MPEPFYEYNEFDAQVETSDAIHPNGYYVNKIGSKIKPNLIDPNINSTHETRIKYTFFIIIYNEENILRHFIDNIMSIDISDVEIILIDDKSLDNSRTILEESIIKYRDNVRIIYNDKNIGFDKNLKKVLEISQGEYILILTPGDFLSLNEINLLLTNAENYDLLLGMRPKWKQSKERLVDNIIRKISSIAIFYSTHKPIIDPLTTILVIKRSSLISIKETLGENYSRTKLIQQFIFNDLRVSQIGIYLPEGVSE